MRGYLIQNTVKNRLVRLADALLRLATFGARRDFPIDAPKRILLSDLAHMGDALVASAMIPILAKRFPSAEIGFLLGSWSKPILDNHPALTRIHVFDHLIHNRGGKGRIAKLRQHLGTRAKALREIRAARYDVAIDLYYNVGNSFSLLRRAGIQARIGYPTGGFGPLLTHSLPWVYRNIHASEYMAALLAPLGITAYDPAAMAYSPVFPAGGGAGVGRAPYIVFHMGTGMELKEWPLPKWKELASRLAHAGHRLLFTGVGDREATLAEQAMAGLPNCENACNRLTWPGFLNALGKARAVICPDTLAAHLTAAFGPPVVVLSAGIPNPYHWVPLSPKAIVLSREVPCSPCFLSRGCPGMECIKDIPVDRAHDALLTALAAPVPTPGDSG